MDGGEGKSNQYCNLRAQQGGEEQNTLAAGANQEALHGSLVCIEFRHKFLANDLNIFFSIISVSVQPFYCNLFFPF